MARPPIMFGLRRLDLSHGGEGTLNLLWLLRQGGDDADAQSNGTQSEKPPQHPRPPWSVPSDAMARDRLATTKLIPHTIPMGHWSQDGSCAPCTALAQYLHSFAREVVVATIVFVTPIVMLIVRIELIDVPIVPIVVLRDCPPVAAWKQAIAATAPTSRARRIHSRALILVCPITSAGVPSAWYVTVIPELSRCIRTRGSVAFLMDPRGKHTSCANTKQHRHTEGFCKRMRTRWYVFGHDRPADRVIHQRLLLLV